MNRFQSWALSKKLGACFGAMMVLSLGFGAYSDRAMAALGKSEDLAVNGLAKKVELAGLLDAAAERMRSDTRLLALAAYSKDAPEAQAAISDFQVTSRESAKAVDAAAQLIDGETEERIVRTLRKNAEAMNLAFGEMATLSSSGNAAGLNRILKEKVAPLAQEADTTTDQLRAEQVSDWRPPVRKRPRQLVAAGLWRAFWPRSHSP